MLNYQAIEIYTSEQARHDGKSLVNAVIDYLRTQKLAARCIVTRGITGSYENGEVATSSIELLSYNLPICITIILPAAATAAVLERLEPMIDDGLVALRDLQVVSHKAANTFFPRQLLVKDVMTTEPRTVGTDTVLGDAAQILLSAPFTGLPVVDHSARPVGVLTQGDLINRGGLPIRLDLLDKTGAETVESIMQTLRGQRVGETMTAPPVTIHKDQSLHDAVELMLSKDLKRLLVVDGSGKLCGILSRLDIFRTVMHEAPDWDGFRTQNITVANLTTVKDIARRDTHMVLPDETIDRVIRIIDDNDLQRVAVVDGDGKLLGIISDRDLLHYFSPDQFELPSLFAKFIERVGSAKSETFNQHLQSTRAADVMTTNPYTINESAVLEDAIRIMTEKGLKRLPVIDSEGRFSGMISRDSLLRSGFLQATRQIS